VLARGVETRLESALELEFLGVGVRTCGTSGGWHQPTGLYLDLLAAFPEPSAEDTAILQSLMAVGSQSALEFIA